MYTTRQQFHYIMCSHQQAENKQTKDLSYKIVITSCIFFSNVGVLYAFYYYFFFSVTKYNVFCTILNGKTRKIIYTLSTLNCCKFKYHIIVFKAFTAIIHNHKNQ